MKTVDILQKFPEIKIVEQEKSLLSAVVGREDFAQIVTKLVSEHDLFLSLLFATDDRKEKQVFGVHVILSNDAEQQWLKLSIELPENDPVYESLTKTVMAAHWYERYLHDMFGVVPEGHPDLHRLVKHENMPSDAYPLRKDFAWNTKMEKVNEPYPMAHIEGEGIYEIPVGPIHAGIIEPGHFRFNVAGERILTLEGKLFFTHKGVEKLLEGKTIEQALLLIERVSGDAAAAHALAFVQAVEEISNCQVSERAKMLRMIVSEMERLTMHMHDLANMGGMGTGYSFIAANGFRIKERLMRASHELLGNRFWRGFIVPGGVARDLSSTELEMVLKEAQTAWAEMREIVVTALGSDGFLDRLQTTGVLPLEAAKAFGAVGLPARASGLSRDARINHPYAAYAKYQTAIATKTKGDVHARFLMRIKESDNAIALLEKLISELPMEAVTNDFEIKDGFALGAVESWRGEILCALAIKDGVIQRCFPRDPSFCNWALFGIMGPGNIVPDFPLINKSLNLSYSGTDL